MADRERIVRVAVRYGRPFAVWHAAWLAGMTLALAVGLALWCTHVEHDDWGIAGSLVILVTLIVFITELGFRALLFQYGIVEVRCSQCGDPGFIRAATALCPDCAQQADSPGDDAPLP